MDIWVIPDSGLFWTDVLYDFNIRISSRIAYPLKLSKEKAIKFSTSLFQVNLNKHNEMIENRLQNYLFLELPGYPLTTFHVGLCQNDFSISQ